MPFAERLLGRVPEEYPAFHDPAFRPDGTGVAYGITQAPLVPGYEAYRRMALVVDGRPGRWFWAVFAPVWTPDGARVAHRALAPMAVEPDRQILEAKSYIVVRDSEGTEQKSWTPREASDPVFTPDGRLAYTARDVAGEWRLEIEGLGDRALGHGTLVAAGKPAFSPDGSRWALRVKREGEDGWRVRVGGEDGELFGDVGFPVFSPDGARVLYRAERGGDVFALTGGRRGRPYESVAGWGFAPDGRAWFLGRHDGKVHVVLDGVESEPFDGVSPPGFSPDGRRIVFCAGREGQMFLVEGRPRVLPGCQDAGWIVFAPDGATFAYREKIAGKWIVVWGDRRSEAFDWTGTPSFSADGRQVGFGATRGREIWWRVL